MGRVAVIVLMLAAVPLHGVSRTKIDLRASPRLSFAPTTVYAVLELKGENEESTYCPSVEWEWDDGTRSIRESDCEPFEQGAPGDRIFTADHVYRRGGDYRIRVTLRKGNRVLQRVSAGVTVRSGLSQ